MVCGALAVTQRRERLAGSRPAARIRRHFRQYGRAFPGVSARTNDSDRRSCHGTLCRRRHCGSRAAWPAFCVGPGRPMPAHSPGLATVVIAIGLVTWPASSSAGAVDPHAGIARRASTMVCLGCHDDVIARDLTNHPIDFSYDAAARRPGARLKPPSALPLAIQLEDGRVGCASCHDLGSPIRARLATSNERSALCFACHDL